MFAYNFSLALRSLKDRPGLTVLVLLAMSVGLGLFITFYTSAQNGSDIPHGDKASSLFLIQMDNRELSADKIDRAISMPDTTYRDAVNLYNLDMPATRQTYVMRTWATLSFADGDVRPMQSRGAATTADFFAMFEPPFLYGSGWRLDADGGDNQVVLGKTMNEKLFGGINSVGKSFLLNNKPVTVVGVMDSWHLSWRLYDRGFYQGYPHDFFVPVQYALNQNFIRDTRFDCWEADQPQSSRFTSQDLDILKTSECGWLAFWAELPEADRGMYQEKLNAYINEQKAYGRFPREVHTFVLNVVEQMDFLNANYGEQSSVIMALLFYAVCLLNAIGILLAKFVRRSKEVSVRRALGARKSAIILQHTLEVVILGLCSAVLGLGIAQLGLKAMVQIRLWASDYNARFEDVVPFFQLDWSLAAQAFLISVLCALLISIYPIWRLCSQPVAGYLKSQ
ncbi:ABC transporter permease [Bowmanella sp. Y26]|uniref:ABC transporter permease n=1 Tax=Bowmanella yangjiangensis TaxID=2811230 RepID=UPI001BDC9052|nr:ABC transporter permease [Bowmanella yangjiangensis]MBT1063204.1 ABC transporter permease [Bowmanella yangjiangensis]